MKEKDRMRSCFLCNYQTSPPTLSLVRRGSALFRGSSNGRTPGFGPGYLGSNPGPRANNILVCQTDKGHIMSAKIKRTQFRLSSFDLDKLTVNSIIGNIANFLTVFIIILEL